MIKLFYLIFILNLISCQSVDYKKKLNQFINIYQLRTDFKGFLNLYSDEVEFKDIIYGYKFDSKEGLAKFFDWNNPDFKKLHSQTFSIENIIWDDETVIIEGYFLEFLWKDEKVNPMYFTTKLKFNDQGKIIKHIDWINYPDKLLKTRLDSNKWIEEN